MYIWIFIVAIGLICIGFGFSAFIDKYQSKKPLKNSNYLLGVFLPLLAALMYSDTLLELIPEVTIIDLGAYFIIGMISGFFTALFLLQRKSIPANHN